MTPILTSADEARAMRVLDGIELKGQMNTPDLDVKANIASSIRRGFPQAWRTVPKMDRIALVGSGPSLADTEGELVELLRAGAKLVTVNGAYHWCLARNLVPNAQVVLDARASTARFVNPPLPQCRYYAASQCDPSVFDALEGHEFAAIFHAVSDQGDGDLKALLDTYYLEQWQGVPGGTTVITRALGLLRMLGYLRYDLFGVDSCWMGDQHHAIDQPENQRDQKLRVTVSPVDAPELGRTFECAPWMLKQFEDVLQMIRLMGEHFLLHVHGDGLVAYAIRTSGGLQVHAEAVE